MAGKTGCKPAGKKPKEDNTAASMHSSDVEENAAEVSYVNTVDEADSSAPGHAGSSAGCDAGHKRRTR